jgi:hypothetical protein
MRTLFLKVNQGVGRALRPALQALLALVAIVYGLRATLSVLLDRLPSTLELVGSTLLLSMLAITAMRWHHKRRMRRVIVDLQDSALW